MKKGLLHCCDCLPRCPNCIYKNSYKKKLLRYINIIWHNDQNDYEEYFDQKLLKSDNFLTLSATILREDFCCAALLVWNLQPMKWPNFPNFAWNAFKLGTHLVQMMMKEEKQRGGRYLLEFKSYWGFSLKNGHSGWSKSPWQVLIAYLKIHIKKSYQDISI